jgi:hypothetical protein
MIACDVGRAITMGSIPLALLMGHLGPVQLFVTGAVGGVFAVFFEAAEAACLPNVVAKDQLTAAVTAHHQFRRPRCGSAAGRQPSSTVARAAVPVSRRGVLSGIGRGVVLGEGAVSPK